jgi:hypothetical protein
VRILEVIAFMIVVADVGEASAIERQRCIVAYERSSVRGLVMPDRAVEPCVVEEVISIRHVGTIQGIEAQVPLAHELEVLPIVYEFELPLVLGAGFGKQEARAQGR